MHIQNFRLVSDQVDYSELQVIINNLQKTIDQNTTGDIVEFGCYEGTTSLFIRRLLDECQSDKQLHVYDSFMGLPEKTKADQSPAGEQFKAGELSTTREKLIKNFKAAGLKLPIIHKGWFNELTTEDIPELISFAFLDGDFYESIDTSLKLITPRLSKGAIIVVDDYQSESLPGASRAVDLWLKSHPSWKLHAEKSLAIIRT